MKQGWVWETYYHRPVLHRLTEPANSIPRDDIDKSTANLSRNCCCFGMGMTRLALCPKYQARSGEDTALNVPGSVSGARLMLRHSDENDATATLDLILPRISPSQTA